MAAAGRRPVRERAWWLLLAALFVGITGLRGTALLFDHNLNSIDGALQTWFALDHFASGAQLGHGFQSYLGITMILALLPVYLAGGQTLFASTLAAKLLVVAGAFAGALAIAWFVRPIARHQRWLVAIVLLFVFIYLGGLVAKAMSYPYPATLDPGVSLRPLRGALPFFVLPVFVAVVRKAQFERSGWVPGALLGLVAGAGLLWSNDAGIPLVIGLGLGIVAALHRLPAVLGPMLAGLALGTATGAGALLAIVTHGAPRGWLQYNFRDVAGDQFWFFGPWDRATRILGPADLLNLLEAGELLSTASLIGLTTCVVIAAARRMAGRGSPVRGAGFVFVGASLVGTALIPQVGGHVGSEYNAITFDFGACAPLILLQRRLLRQAKPLLRRFGPRGLTVVAALSAAAMLVTDSALLASALTGTDRSVYSKPLGFHVTPTYAAELAAMERLGAHWRVRGIPANRRLLSVFTSPLDIAAGVDSPAPVGSLIHALGPANRAFVTGLVDQREVAAVTTIAPDYSGWEGWLLRANWPFFRALRDNYTPIGRTDQNVLWVRNDAAAATARAAACRVTQPAPSVLVVEVAPQAPGLASVTLERQGPYAAGRSALLTISETSPATRDARARQWDDFPRYGIANAPTLELVAPVDGAGPTRLRLEVMDGSAIGTGRCRAGIYPLIDHDALPPLPQAGSRIITEDAR